MEIIDLKQKEEKLKKFFDTILMESRKIDSRIRLQNNEYCIYKWRLFKAIFFRIGKSSETIEIYNRTFLEIIKKAVKNYEEESKTNWIIILK